MIASVPFSPSTIIETTAPFKRVLAQSCVSLHPPYIIHPRSCEDQAPPEISPFRLALSVFNYRANGFKLALISVTEKLNGVDARIVHTQRDEIMVESREHTVDRVHTIVKDSMEEPMGRIILEIPFAVEPRVDGARGLRCDDSYLTRMTKLSFLGAAFRCSSGYPKIQEPTPI